MILPNQVLEAERVRRTWCAAPPSGVTLEQISNNEYWAHIARKLSVGDHIEVIPEDRTFYAELLVNDVDKTHVRVKVIHFVQIVDEVSDIPETSGYTISHRGAAKMWCVKRKVDNVLIKENCHTKAEAKAWLAEYEMGL